MASASHHFDTSIEIVTPENIAFRYQIAGPFRRLPAYVIDVIVRLGVLLFLGVLLACSGLDAFVGVAPVLIALFVMEWFYGGLFEAIWNGQTPGKRAMRLRVVSIDGSPITATQAVLRNFLRFADMMPFVLGRFFATMQVGLFVMAANRRFQRMGDLVTGTMVVVEVPTRQYGVIHIADPDVLALAASIPPGFRVSRELAPALSQYVGRRVLFSVTRRAEIARHLGEPLCERFGLPGDTNHDLLLCALYAKTFIDESAREGIDRQASTEDV